VARSVPTFSMGKSTVTRAARTFSGFFREGREGLQAPSSRTSDMRAACRSRMRADSPGTGRNVPLDCSPAMMAAAFAGSISDSR
jgi:hypothetical protein